MPPSLVQQGAIAWPKGAGRGGVALGAGGRREVTAHRRHLGPRLRGGADLGGHACVGRLDTLYLSYNLDMAREFIGYVADWARALAPAGEGALDLPAKSAQTFRVSFASGFEAAALPSRARSLRGRQGLVLIDEAAFHDDLDEVLKAALALLVWGGRVAVVSTHDGVASQFHRLVEDCRGGRAPHRLLTTPFDEALGDGLYRRICLARGESWSPEAEGTWRAEIFRFYGDAAEEELLCVPRRSGGGWLPAMLVESRMTDAPVLRLALDPGFAERPEAERERDTANWCAEHLTPPLARLDPELPCCLGEDFGRDRDLTVIWPLQIGRDLVRRTPFTVELSNVPFRQQERILFHIIDRLPRFRAAAMDARGNGQYLAEVAMQRYGAKRVQRVMLSADWYRQHMPRYKAALEDARITLPRDADILADHRLVAIEGGVAKVPASARASGSDGRPRHGDAAIAAALAWSAGEEEQTVIDVRGSGRRRVFAGGGPAWR